MQFVGRGGTISIQTKADLPSQSLKLADTGLSFSPAVPAAEIPHWLQLPLAGDQSEMMIRSVFREIDRAKLYEGSTSRHSHLPPPPTSGLPLVEQLRLLRLCRHSWNPVTAAEKAQIAYYEKYVEAFMPLWLETKAWLESYHHSHNRWAKTWFNPETCQTHGIAYSDDQTTLDWCFDGIHRAPDWSPFESETIRVRRKRHRLLKGLAREGYKLWDIWGPAPPLPDCDARKWIKDGQPPQGFSGTWIHSNGPVTLSNGRQVGCWHRCGDWTPDPCPEYPWGFEFVQDDGGWFPVHEKLPPPSPEYPYGWYVEPVTERFYPRQTDPTASPAPKEWTDEVTAKPYGDSPPLTLDELATMGAAHPAPADFSAIDFLRTIPRGALLGYAVDEAGQRQLVTYPDDRGLLTVAPNRSGKGVSAIGVNAICHRGSFVCFDPKAENTHLFARWRVDALGQPTYVFDPLHVVDDVDLPRPRGSDGYAPLRAGFNPLEFIAKARNPITAAKMIAAAFIPVQGENPFWSQSAQSFFAAFHIFVAIDPGYFKPRTYRNLWTDLTEQREADFRQMLAVMAESSIGFVRSEAIEFLEGAVDTVKGYRKTLKVQAGRILDDPDIIECLCQPSFDFARLQREKVSVFIVLPGDMARDYANFMRLLLCCMFSEIERCGLPEPGSRPDRTMIIFDEFATLGRSDTLREAMPRLPGYGVTIWPFCQDFGQIRDLYGDKGWETFVGAAGVLQAFGGQPDNFTAEYLSKKTGQVTEATVSQTNPAAGSNQSRTTSSTGRPGMFPYEFSYLNAKPADQKLEILFYAGKGYARAQRLLTYEDFPLFQAFQAHEKATRTRRAADAAQQLRGPPTGA